MQAIEQRMLIEIDPDVVFSIPPGGTVATFTPATDKGKQVLEEHFTGAENFWLDGSLIVEHGYVQYVEGVLLKQFGLIVNRV